MNDLPIEIIDIILEKITDPRDLSQVRKTCTLFNGICIERTKLIREKKVKPHNTVEEFWPKISRNGSIRMKFLLSFHGLTHIDFPVYISNYTDLCVIGMLKYLKKVAMRLDTSLDINLLFNFFTDYKDGYVLTNGLPQKQKRDLAGICFKIISKKVIRWITEGKYGLIHLDHPRGITGTDLILITIINAKILITNSIRESIMDELDIEKAIIPIPLNELEKNDFNPFLRSKEYTYQPVQYKFRENLSDIQMRNLSCVGVNTIRNETRPSIVTYEMPVDPVDLESVFNSCTNLEKIGVFIRDESCVNFVLNYCNAMKMKSITLYTYTPIKDIKLHEHVHVIDLNKLKTQEEFVDSQFSH